MAIFAVACLILSLVVAAVNWRRGEDARSSLRSYSALALLLLGTWVMLFASIPVDSRTLSARSTECVSNTKYLALAALMYTNEWDERMPVANLRPNFKKFQKRPEWTCPKEPEKFGYGFNGYLKGASLAAVSDPAERLLLTEADLSVDWITRDNEIIGGHAGRGPVAFADTHVKRFTHATKAQWTENKAVNFSLAKGSDYKADVPWDLFPWRIALALLLGGFPTSLAIVAFHRDPIRKKFWKVALAGWLMSFLMLGLIYPAF